MPDNNNVHECSRPKFQGQARTIKLVSNCLGYGPTPLPDDEAEQRLSITEDGRVFFSSYNYGDGNKYVEAKSLILKMEHRLSAHILKLIGDYFSDDFDVPFATDVGVWKLYITNTDGITFIFTGSLCSMTEELDYISSNIRTILDMPDLLLFDGNSHEDRIEKLVIAYHRVSKRKLDEPPNPEEYVTWNCTEHIIINRDSETLEHILKIDSGLTISKKYHVEGSVAELLDNCYSPDLFSNTTGNPPDVIEDPMESKDYIITVDYLYGDQRVYSGSFDKNGLPEDYPELVKHIVNFTYSFRMSDILNPSVYSKTKRRESDYIFCSVEFKDGGKSYYYLTDDDTLEIGDYVIVPVGKHDKTAIVVIVDIEYFSEDDAPFPLDKIKHIIRKCVDEDFDAEFEAEYDMD